MSSVKNMAQKAAGRVIRTAAERLDTWSNTVTGLGDQLRDKVMSTLFLKRMKMSDELLETLYHGDDMSARVVEALPEEAMRPGFTIDLGKETGDENLLEALSEKLTALGAHDAILEACIWGRLYGGAVMYIGADDGSQDQAQPLNEANIKSVDFLLVLDKRDIQPYSYYSGELSSKLGEPEVYRIIQATASPVGGTLQMGPNSLIHESRFIRFDGSRTSRRRRLQNEGWHESVLQKCDEVLKMFGVSWQAAGHLFNEASIGIFKIQGLIDMIAQGDKDTLQERMQLIDMSKSVARGVMLDAEMESFERASYNFAGVSDLLQMFMLRFAAAARMPVTVLMGQSPAGMDATGESDLKLWYNQARSFQIHYLESRIRRLVQLLITSQEISGADPKGWGIKFGPLWEPTALEQATLEKTVADKDAVYINSQVVLPEEIALARFPRSGWSPHTQIDLKAREEMLEAELLLAKEKAGQDPVDEQLKLKELNAPELPEEPEEE